MSGRSAYVRKKKGDTHEKDAALQFQLQQAAARQHFLEQNEESMLARSDSSRQHTVNAVNYPTRSGASFSSGSSDNGRHALPSLQAVNASVSAIEKSSLRAYMDNKSDQIRNKLAAKFSPKPEPIGSYGMRPETRSAVSRGRADPYVAAELPSTPITIPHTINSTLAPSRPRVVKTNDSLGLGFDGRTRSGDESRIKRWMGSGKPPQPWNKLRKVTHSPPPYPPLRCCTAGDEANELIYSLANSFTFFSLFYRTRSCGIQPVTLLSSLDMRRTKPLDHLRRSASLRRCLKRRNLRSLSLSSAKATPTMNTIFPLHLRATLRRN
jgi:hypothetical protein